MIALGIILLILAVGLVIGELYTGSGLLLAGAIAAIIFGLVILFTQGSLLIQINLWVAVPLIILVIGLIIFVIQRVISIHHQKAVTGIEGLEGKTVVVKKTLNPEGTVFYQGEYWNAISKSGRMETGEEAVIEKVDGLMLYVIKRQKS